MSKTPGLKAFKCHKEVLARPMTGIMRYFAYKHLPEKLQKVSKPVGDLALLMNELPDGPEKSAGIRKLLEAKDCFVRAALG